MYFWFPNSLWCNYDCAYYIKNESIRCIFTKKCAILPHWAVCIVSWMMRGSCVVSPSLIPLNTNLPAKGQAVSFSLDQSHQTQHFQPGHTHTATPTLTNTHAHTHTFFFFLSFQWFLTLYVSNLCVCVWGEAKAGHRVRGQRSYRELNTVRGIRDTRKWTGGRSWWQTEACYWLVIAMATVGRSISKFSKLLLRRLELQTHGTLILLNF